MATAGYTKEDIAAFEELQKRQDGQAIPIGEEPPIEAVYERCGVRAGTVDLIGDQPEEVAEQNEQWRQWTVCMNERGWKVELTQVDPSRPYALYPRHDIPTDAETLEAFNADESVCAAAAGIPYLGPEDE